MAKSMVDDIRNAEQQGEKIIADANLKAKAISDEAAIKAKKISDEIILEAKTKAEKILADAKNDAQEKGNSAKSRSGLLVDSLNEAATKNSDAVIERTIDLLKK